MRVTDFLKKMTGSYAAASVLLLFAAVSVALACTGSERALDLMKYYVAMAVPGVLAFLCLAACFRVRKRPALLLLHLGFACILGGWVLNALTGPSDRQIRLRAGQSASVEGSFSLRLDTFTIDRWPDTGTVRQYTSTARLFDEKAASEGIPVTIAVNHPLVHRGWWLYQSSYQELQNPHTGEPLYFTILNAVRDTGLPIVFFGGLALILGSFFYLFTFYRRVLSSDAPASPRRFIGFGAPASPAVVRLARCLYGLVALCTAAMLVHRSLTTGHPPMQNLYEFLMCASVLIPCLTFVSARVDRQDTLAADAFLQTLVLIPVCFVMDGDVHRLMPALQSPLFVPHVGAYVLGYIILVRAALGAGRRLTGVGFFLLTLGLVLGAAWGKICWGHWWQFDPKEMWSLATWFVYAAGFHLRAQLSPRAKRAFLWAGAVMIILTLTWINLSRIFSGMHSYA